MNNMRFDTPYNQRSVPPHRETRGAAKEDTAPKARAWNSWWSRRSPNLKTNDNPPARIGIDIGSKTIKLVALDEGGDIVFADYHRHRSNVHSALAELVSDIIWRHGDMTLPMAFTGSAGIALADELGIPFVQEVVAAAGAVRRRHPQADCIIELGGEDAKITYLTDTPEQRMNATCAGGTGDFIDGITSMLGCKTREISKLALGAQQTYPIASRCAVFARTDVRPLINAGARKADIAQSALEAVVRQTLGGLACGRPIRGTVVFLGGPLEHIPALVMTFRRMLDLTPQTGIKPADAHLYCAMGAIEEAQDAPIMTLSELASQLRTLAMPDDETGSFPPLFDNEAQRAEFKDRHALEHMKAARLEDAHGPMYLGFDAGSTTMKYTLIDSAGTIVASGYQTVEGDTLDTARAMIEELLLALDGGSYSKGDRYLARAAVTGYGEDLLRAGFGFDDGVVETVAHLRAAQHYQPDLSFMLDIGGQDMKALWVRDGHVVDAVLNEACSSGCGAFVQSSAKSLNLSHESFDQAALQAAHPIDLGAKCTVFMTSRVRHAQKTGVETCDIAAGIAYSVVNNALTRIIGAERTSTLGDKVVVQGGAFKSDAVLRAFEKVTGVNAIRPATAHLMGAYGAALIARDASGRTSSFVTLEQLRDQRPQRQALRCKGCGNACLLSVVDFGNGRRFVSGNRCERASAIASAGKQEKSGCAPNVIAREQELAGSYRDTQSQGERGSTTIGLMNALNIWQSMPFWHTFFTSLGFSVFIPDDKPDSRTQDEAAETIPSESVCHPAKVSHVRYARLKDLGADFAFMPRYDRGSRCPVASLYADALAVNAHGLRMISPTLKSIHPEKIAACAEDLQALYAMLGDLAEHAAPITSAEFDHAIERAVEEQHAFESALEHASASAFAWAAEEPDRRVALVAGRPYHCDPELMHDIDRVLSDLGFAVVPASSAPRRQGVHTLWKPSRRLAGLVAQYARNPKVEIVALRSFGCGYDAVSFDEARTMAHTLHRPFTELKIDDIADTAHIRIRLRTLAYTSSLEKPPHGTDSSQPERLRAAVTPDLCSTAKALVEAAANDLQARPGAMQLHVPQTCKNCLTDALPFELHQLFGCAPEVIETEASGRESASAQANGLTVGLLGNPLLVFNPDLNDHVEDLLQELGCTVVYPQPDLIARDDVRYLEQLRRFSDQGVQRIIYLQSFGCLKGHVQSRGAARDLERLFPNLPITIVDFDPESSALNRENRIRLAVSRRAGER